MSRLDPDGNGTRRRGTATSRFGVGRRESHDASEFYRRFKPPKIVASTEVTHPHDWPVVDEIVHGDIRDLPATVAAHSVALVVTSPPYYSGKEYEVGIGQGHVPASYEKYLDMLHGVFASCARALEPGGRIAVNVANLGRKPYRSLSRDVTDIFEDLELLLRGEVIWQKAKGAAGNCAWGTYQKPGDPVLRDLTERVIIASRYRFDRALEPRVRHELGYPSEASIFRDEFLEATTDVWEIPPESATRVNHPAPFPVELPQRLIDLYTYRGDLVLDPFMGSGTTAVAALRTQRHYIGYDTDAGYVNEASDRLERERQRLARMSERGAEPPRVVLPAVPAPADPDEDFQARAVREGRRARELAEWALTEAQFRIVGRNKRLEGGVDVDFVALDHAGNEWLFDVSGGFTSTRGRLRRTDALWKALGKATVLQHTRAPTRFVLLTTDLPARNSAGARALAAVTGPDPRRFPVYDVIELRADDGLRALRDYSQGRRSRR
jgi:DNA modification methylase